MSMIPPDLARRNGKAAPNGSAPAPPSNAVSDGAAAVPEQPGRGEAGRFAKGNKFSKGNPFARRMGGLRTAFLNSVTEEDMQAVARVLLTRAKNGNLDAAKLLFLYALGKPAKAADPDRLDLDEFNLLDAWPTAARVFATLMDATDPETAASIVRQTLASRGVEGATKNVLKKSRGHLENAVEEIKARRGRPTPKAGA